MPLDPELREYYETSLKSAEEELAQQMALDPDDPSYDEWVIDDLRLDITYYREQLEDGHNNATRTHTSATEEV